MSAPRVPDEVLLEKIAEVFRREGYEGASIRLLSAATGLERASLYHRFPGGKEQMATAIVTMDCEWMSAHVFVPLKAEGSPRDKLLIVAANLKNFYKGGTLGCILDSLTLSGTEKIRQMIKDAYLTWLDSFTAVSIEAGQAPDQARLRARQAIVEIEGSLVLSRVTSDPEVFLATLNKLPELLGS